MEAVSASAFPMKHHCGDLTRLLPRARKLFEKVFCMQPTKFPSIGCEMTDHPEVFVPCDEWMVAACSLRLPGERCNAHASPCRFIDKCHATVSVLRFPSGRAGPVRSTCRGPRHSPGRPGAGPGRLIPADRGARADPCSYRSQSQAPSGMRSVPPRARRVPEHRHGWSRWKTRVCRVPAQRSACPLSAASFRRVRSTVPFRGVRASSPHPMRDRRRPMRSRPGRARLGMTRWIPWPAQP